MNPDEYRAPEAGRIVYTPTGYAAFVPAPLPPTLSYTPELALTLSQADAALGELSGIGRLLPNPHLLIASTLTLLLNPTRRPSNSPPRRSHHAPNRR